MRKFDPIFLCKISKVKKILKKLPLIPIQNFFVMLYLSGKIIFTQKSMLGDVFWKR
jgi:hypothetical protein